MSKLSVGVLNKQTGEFFEIQDFNIKSEGWHILKMYVNFGDPVEVANYSLTKYIPETKNETKRSTNKTKKSKKPASKNRKVSK